MCLLLLQTTGHFAVRDCGFHHGIVAGAKFFELIGLLRSEIFLFAQIVGEVFDLRPKGIIQMLDLLRPIYEKTAAYGHFGREEPEFSWERTDKVTALRAAAGV